MVIASLVLMAGATAAILYAFRDNMIFFYTPHQYVEKYGAVPNAATGEVRIGGLVKQGSVTNREGGGLEFTITDLTAEMPVRYQGMVPSLFREGQGVVAQGIVNAKGTLIAQTILAKHDEQYMPREVVEALKASGQWQEGQAYAKPPAQGGAP